MIFANEVDNVLKELGDMLKQKNIAYGNSALKPQRIFSTASSIEQINVRIDDKLSRIKNQMIDDEDAEFDLMGYLVLKRIATMTTMTAGQSPTKSPSDEKSTVADEVLSKRVAKNIEKFIGGDVKVNVINGVGGHVAFAVSGCEEEDMITSDQLESIINDCK